MLLVGTRPVTYFSFDSNAGLALHGAQGAVNDEEVSKAFVFLHPFWGQECIPMNCDKKSLRIYACCKIISIRNVTNLDDFLKNKVVNLKDFFK